MSVSGNALTLAQYAIQSNSPLVMKITDSLLKNGSILADLPLVSNKSLLVNGVRWQGNLPTVNWGALNTDPTVTSGTPTPYQEQAFLVRNAIDVDRFLVEDKNQIVNPRSAQMEAFLKSLAYDMNDKFINNDPVSGNVNAPVGIRYRTTNYNQWGVNSDMLIDAGGVTMTSSMTSSSANSFIYTIQQLLDYMGSPEGDDVVLYMNDYMKRRFEQAVRLLGAGAGWRTDRDAFDRSITKYKNAKIVDIGRKADQVTRIITITETSSGAAGSSNYTSIYGVKYGMDTAFGWQFEEMMDAVKDIGLIGNNGTVYRLLFDYAVGLVFPHSRAIGRIFDISIN